MAMNSDKLDEFFGNDRTDEEMGMPSPAPRVPLTRLLDRFQNMAEESCESEGCRLSDAPVEDWCGKCVLIECGVQLSKVEALLRAREEGIRAKLRVMNQRADSARARGHVVEAMAIEFCIDDLESLLDPPTPEKQK
jgi:hypothetical protein